MCKLKTDKGVPAHEPGNHSDYEAEISCKTTAVHYRPSTIDYRDSSDDDEINLFMLRISKDLFSCG